MVLPEVRVRSLLCDGLFGFRPEYNTPLQLDLLVQIVTRMLGETLLIGAVS